MYCPRCNWLIQAEDANLSTLVARCRMCQEVFRFEDQLRPSDQATSGARRAEQPEDFEIEDRGAGTPRRIWMLWPVGVRVVGGMVFFFLMIGLICFALHVANEFRYLNPGLFVAWGVVLMLAGGVGYFAVALLLNDTRIDWTDDMFVYRCGPLPSPVTRRFRTSEIRRIEFSPEPYWLQGMLRHRFIVMAVYQDGRRKLVVEMPTPDRARFIADQLQEWLAADRLPAPDKAIVPASEAIQRAR
jgi:hypothetical protein